MSTPRRVPSRVWASARRADLNAVESFAPFAAPAIVANVAGKADAMTAFWATSFLWLRLAHAIAYRLAFPFVKTLAFTLGFIAVVGISWQAIRSDRNTDATPSFPALASGEAKPVGTDRGSQTCWAYRPTLGATSRAIRRA
jgi:uncharacterized MAPEG superfamily protein